jgi:large-conductance mechanosensitive channel
MKSIVNWIFHQRDIDTQVISLMVAAALTGIVKDLSDGVIDPLVAGTLKIDRVDEQQVGPYKFKVQLLVSGIIKAAIILVLVYQFARATKNL